MLPAWPKSVRIRAEAVGADNLQSARVRADMLWTAQFREEVGKALEVICYEGE